MLQGNQTSQQGFTLIELSIVLVIIGLIVGGILVGQDLIRAAELRSTIAQIEKYNTAVNTFRVKYNGIPGDLPFATSNSFGLNSATLTTGGDGSGVIQGFGADTVSFAGEPVSFWNNLSLAQLIDGSFGTAITTGALMGGNAYTTTAAQAYMPTAKLGRGNLINAHGESGINYFLISGFGNGSAAIAATAGLYGAQTNNLTPIESRDIDTKMDDGVPGSGGVQAISSVVVLTASSVGTPAPVAGCVASSAYVVSTSGGNTQACSLRLRFN